MAEVVGAPVLHREVVLVRVELHEPLHRAGAGGAVAEHRGRHHGPPELARHHVRGHLPIAQGAVGEVPQRRLALPRLVHRVRLVVAAPDASEERGVRCTRHEAEDLHVAVGEQPEGLLVACEGAGHQTAAGPWPFMAGHTCPSGSSGLPQN